MILDSAHPHTPLVMVGNYGSAWQVTWANPRLGKVTLNRARLHLSPEYRSAPIPAQCRFKYYIRLIDSTYLWNGVSTWFFFVQLGLGLSWTLKWASTTTPPHPTPPPGTFRPPLDKLGSWNLAQILTKPTRLRNRTHSHPNPPHLTLSLRRKLKT